MHWTAWIGITAMAVLGLVALRLLGVDNAPKVHLCGDHDFSNAILVAVISEDDDLDVGETLASLFEQAACPQRVRALVLTRDLKRARLSFTTASTASGLAHHAHHAQVQYVDTPDITEALRNAFRNEPWLVLTTTRTRFPTMWDGLLLDQLRKAPPQAVLSSPLALPLFGSQMPTDPPPYLKLVDVEGNHLQVEARALREMPHDNVPVPQVAAVPRFLAGRTDKVLAVATARTVTALTKGLLANQCWPYAPGTHLAFSTTPSGPSAPPSSPLAWTEEELRRMRSWAMSSTRTTADTDYTAALKAA